MEFKIIQVQAPISLFNKLSVNAQVRLQFNQTLQIMVPPQVNYSLVSFERKKNHREPQEIKLYIQAKIEIYKEADKLYITVSNTKAIIDPFLSLENKYSWG